jgi:uncharacterized protein YqjF (DUF2071 family)
MSPEPIDRVTPTVRPGRRALMVQKWRSLLFLHWEVPLGALRRVVPAGLELDLFEGRAYVGLVPFTMRRVRPVGLPAVPWLSDSHETNVRTYVHVGGRDPGVWFFSLDASNPVAVVLARSLAHLNYHRARMSLERADDGVIRYRSERLWPGPVPAAHDIRARPAGTPAPAAVGTLDHFLLERYLLYAARGGRLYRGRVHHAPYPAQGAEVFETDETLIAAAGLERPPAPPIAHFAAGVDVEVFAIQPLTLPA